ncbi:hypothetical protein RvY_02232 [Ramazzottius varieornatus]|uniref:Mos1 transposase HTH domain-containing protein n=1 Tax=Ramazzottius varieornatus TaxID=947166 RepID=A0A1D1UU64_RAMVA|nr:hypothetical protein RvY_02232 [Ramazzottius varieornatus]
MDKSILRTIFEHESCRGTNAVQAARNSNDEYDKYIVYHKRTHVRGWYERFRSGDFSLEDHAHGKPNLKVDNDMLKEVVEANPSQTLSELAEQFDVSHSAISDHLLQIGKV